MTVVMVEAVSRSDSRLINLKCGKKTQINLLLMAQPKLKIVLDHIHYCLLRSRVSTVWNGSKNVHKLLYTILLYVLN